MLHGLIFSPRPSRLSILYIAICTCVRVRFFSFRNVHCSTSKAKLDFWSQYQIYVMIFKVIYRVQYCLLISFFNRKSWEPTSAPACLSGALTRRLCQVGTQTESPQDCVVRWNSPAQFWAFEMWLMWMNQSLNYIYILKIIYTFKFCFQWKRWCSTLVENFLGMFEPLGHAKLIFQHYSWWNWNANQVFQRKN